MGGDSRSFPVYAAAVPPVRIAGATLKKLDELSNASQPIENKENSAFVMLLQLSDIVANCENLQSGFRILREVDKSFMNFPKLY
jgi:hypothetical protein